MNKVIKLMRLFSDPLRLRLFMLLTEKELCVCQLMAILRASQPLVSRNLGLLREAGLLDVRREGKQLFYRASEVLSPEQRRLIETLKEILMNDQQIQSDRSRVVECEEFQKRTGRCGMEAMKRFMEVHG